MSGFRKMGAFAIVLIAAQPSCLAVAKPAIDPVCAPLRQFVSSVSPGDTKSIELHTVWGGGFKGETGATFGAKECDFFDYAPGELACKSLFEHSNIEFAGINALRAISCLSGVNVGHLGRLRRIEMEFAYGSGQRGSNVTITLDEDQRMGGMAMRITAEGY